MRTPAINFSFLEKLLLSLVIVLAGVPIASFALISVSDSSRSVSDIASSTISSSVFDSLSLSTSAEIVSSSENTRQVTLRLDKIISLLEYQISKQK